MPAQKILLCALSDPLTDLRRVTMVAEVLADYGVESEFAKSLCEVCTPEEKAEEFNRALRSQRYAWILDFSGGNLANLVLPYIDYDAYRASRTWYAAFSDGTCIVNALAACSGKRAMLFGVWQQNKLNATLKLIRTRRMQTQIIPLSENAYFPRHAQVYGGNMRCFLKLAGTGRMPKLDDAILVLESSSADLYLFESMAAQMAQLGLFDSLRGVVLGRFNRLEKQIGSKELAWAKMVEILGSLMPGPIPYFAAPMLGHLENGEGIWISAGESAREVLTCQKHLRYEMPASTMLLKTDAGARKAAPGRPGRKTAESSGTAISANPGVADTELMEQLRAQARKAAKQNPGLQEQNRAELLRPFGNR